MRKEFMSIRYRIVNNLHHSAEVLIRRSHYCLWTIKYTLTLKHTSHHHG